MNPIHSSADLPGRPECDDLMLRFHGFEKLADVQGAEMQGAAVQRALGAHYRVSNYVPWTEEDAIHGRLDALLSAFDKKSGHILEHGEPFVDPNRFGTIDFTVTKKMAG